MAESRFAEITTNVLLAGVLNFWTAPTMVVALVLTSVSNSSLTTVATVTVSVLYAPTAPTVAPGQVRKY